LYKKSRLLRASIRYTFDLFAKPNNTTAIADKKVRNNIASDLTLSFRVLNKNLNSFKREKDLIK
tara:strand:- start:810 stop:1001 length:192 start_codon:yes stop_codon:yes gene_type:complete